MFLVTQHDLGILMTPAATMIDCDPRFEIMQGTRAGTPEQAPADRFEANVVPPIAEQAARGRPAT